MENKDTWQSLITLVNILVFCLVFGSILFVSLNLKIYCDKCKSVIQRYALYSNIS